MYEQAQVNLYESVCLDETTVVPVPGDIARQLLGAGVDAPLFAVIYRGMVPRRRHRTTAAIIATVPHLGLPRRRGQGPHRQTRRPAGQRPCTSAPTTKATPTCGTRHHEQHSHPRPAPAAQPRRRRPPGLGVLKQAHQMLEPAADHDGVPVLGPPQPRRPARTLPDLTGRAQLAGFHFNHQQQLLKGDTAR